MTAKNDSFFSSYLRIDDLERLLERHRRTIHRYIESGILPQPYKLEGGKFVYFDKEEVHEYIKKHFAKSHRTRALAA